MNRRKPPIDWPRLLVHACRIIETSEFPPRLGALSGQLGVSASELQRQFTRRLGVSPKTYAQALALHRLARSVARESNTLNAVYAAGFESLTAAYDNANSRLGVAPGRLRGELAIEWWMGLSDLGWMLMAATVNGICWLAFGDEPGTLLEELRAAFPQARLMNNEDRLVDWFNRVRNFILLPREALELPLDVQGTAFQASVWKVLAKIPLGHTVSYSQVAQRLGRTTAVRAVASACASNRVALLIPCHRVVAADGGLAGYRWGVARKAALLERERG